MLRDASRKSEPKASRKKTRGRVVLFPGLVSSAKALKVHRNHLYLVLKGRRISHRLLARYRELQKAA